MSENDSMFGGSMWIFALLILLLIGGGGFGMNSRSGELGQYASAASQQEILFGQQFQTLNQAINKVGDGISSLGYSQLQQMDNNTASINGNVVSEGRALQSQLANCCCENQRNVDSLRYDLANYNNSIQNAIHDDGEKTRAMIYQNKIDAMQSQINQLSMQQAVCGIPKISTYAWGTYPYTQPGCSCSQF